MKFYKRDPDAALAGMAELSLVQRGLYNTVIDLLYSRDGKLPDDDVRIAHMANCDIRQYRFVKAQLMACGKVWIEDGHLQAKRVRSTIDQAEVFSMSQRCRAEVGAKSRQKHNENNDPSEPPTPTPTPTPTGSTSGEEESRVRDQGGTGAGAGKNGTGKRYAKDTVTITDPRLRIERFMNAVAKQIDATFPRMGEIGWQTIIAATDAQDMGHAQAIAMCQRAARDLGKGWPRSWPVDGKFFSQRNGGSA